ncbi:hypothetical protein GGI17_000690 [Coemansia sp. S146]|nr:hypothetical protein GGI17_000690 [Coemansia sp. S146]
MSFVLKAVSAAKNAGRAIRVRLGIARLTSADTTATVLSADLSKHYDTNHRVLLKLDSADWSAVNTSFFALEDWRKELPLSNGDHSALQDVCHLSQRLTGKGERTTPTSLMMSMAYMLGVNDEELDTMPALIENYYCTHLPPVVSL